MSICKAIAGISKKQTAGGYGPRPRKGERNMKKKYETLEEATALYTAHTGNIPEAWEMVDLYHRYRNEWQGYNGFLDWLIYNG